MFQLAKGYNALRWMGKTQPVATLPFLGVVELIFRGNPVSGVGYVSFQAGDPFSIVRELVTGVDYLVVATGSYQVVDAIPSAADAFADFPGYVPAVIDVAPVLPVGRTEIGYAAEVILGGRLVAQTMAGLRHYSSAIARHKNMLFGIALNSALVGGSVSVRRPGFVFYDGWGLTPGATLLAGTDGHLVTEVPETSFYHLIGRALDANTLLYQPEPVIILSTSQTLS